MMIKPPSFNLLNPAEADAAAAWVWQACEVQDTLHDPHMGEINAYGTYISEVINNSVDGGSEASALAFVSAACKAGDFVHAEYVHDLILFTAHFHGAKVYGKLWNAMLDAATSKQPFATPIEAFKEEL